MVKTMKNGKKTEENEGKDSKNHAFLMRMSYRSNFVFLQ